MLKKRYITILFIIIVICSISQVTATDNLDNLTNEDSGQIISQNHDEIQISEGNSGTYSELEDLVTNNFTVDLDRDYVLDESDVNYKLLGIEITHDLTLNGNGHTIHTNMSRVFNISSGVHDVKIYNLNIKNAYGADREDRFVPWMDYGGAIYSEGNLYLENCSFTDCYANAQAGAIFSNVGLNNTLTVNNCTFLRNSILEDYLGGGAIYSCTNLLVNNSRFYDCFGKYGGAIITYNTSVIKNCHFENNTAMVLGGAIMNLDVCEVYNSSFYGNKAELGGALYSVIAINCTFAKNFASYGWGNNMDYGAIFNCTGGDDPNDFINTANSTGFSFRPNLLNFQKGGFNKTLEFLITSNPGNETVYPVGLNIKITNKFNHTRQYTLFSNGKGVVCLPLSEFANGTYNMTVSFLNKIYNASEVNYTLALGISNSKISFSSGVVFEYGRSCSILVEVDGCAVERDNIQILGYPDAEISLNDKEIRISGLDVGNYTLQVKTTPDENHFSTIGNVTITVVKAVAVIKASKLTVALKKGTLWSIALQDSTNHKPIKGMELTLKVYTGSKYKTVTVKTNSKGVATYKTSSLSKGTHKIVVTGKHSGYKFNTLTSSIKVIIPKQLTFKLQKRVNDNKGSLISYIVKDKKTGKGVNGVKIKLLIYTGKKVKTITLKSKKSGKYNGAFGFATNELSVGKHVVKIEPASISYSGSAKTTMIIKKASKNRPLYSHKL